MNGFDGTWEIDLEGALVWNAERGRYEPDQVGQEIITIRTEVDVQDYEVLYGADPVFRMGYRARFDDPGWTDYLVREIITQGSADPAAAIDEFRQRVRADSGSMRREFEVGKPYGRVRLISGDDRTQYRLSRDTKSTEITYIMLRRLDESGNRFTSSVLDREGVITRIRPFRRITADLEIS